MTNAKGIRAGRAYVELGVNDRLTAGLRRAQAQLQAFGAGARQTGTRLLGVGAAITAPFVLATREFIKTGDELEKMSIRTGFTVRSLSELRFAAEQSGASIGSIEGAVRRMQRTLYDAERGVSIAVNVLDDLGLSMSDMAKLSPEEQFFKIADRIGSIEDPSRRAAIALNIFGRRGTELLPLFLEGADGIEALRNRARDLGITFSDEAAKAAKDLTDEINVLRRTAIAVAFNIGSAIAPVVQVAVNTATRIAVSMNRLVRESPALVRSVALIGVGFVALGATFVAVGVSAGVLSFALGGLASAIGFASAAARALGATLAVIASPAAAATGLIALIGTAIAVQSERGREALRGLIDRFASFRDTVSRTLGGVRDALAANDISLAAGVLWAGLRVVWLEGTESIRELWARSMSAFASVGAQVFGQLQAAWARTRDWFERNMPTFTLVFTDAFISTISVIKSAYASSVTFVSGIILEIQGLFDRDLDVEAAKRVGLQELEARKREIERERREAVDEAVRRAGRSDEEREAELAETLAEIDRKIAEVEAEIINSTAERMERAKQELEDARRELDEAIERAKRAKEERDNEDRSRATPEPDTFAEAVGAILRASQSRGTFSPFEARGLTAATTIAERTANASEQTARNTKRIADEVENSAGVSFA